MTVDDIIEQHKTHLLEKKQLRKSKSFSNIFWKDFSSNTDNFWFWVVLPIFPIIASVCLFYGIVTIGTIIITAFIVSGIVFVAKCLRYLFEDALDEMREKEN